MAIKIGGATVIDNNQNITITGTITASGGDSSDWNAAYTHAQVTHAAANAIVPGGSKVYKFHDQESSGVTEFHDLGSHDLCFQSGWTHSTDYGSSWVKCRVIPLLDGGSCNSSGINYPEEGDTVTAGNLHWCMSYGSQNSTGGDDSVDCRATCIDFT